ncbi:hypothetical protein ACFL4G_00945 [Thermodesulfobacteriota bacterium]
MKRRKLGPLPLLFLGLTLSLGCSGSDVADFNGPDVAEFNGLDTEDFRLIASDGIDERLNSYPWAMEQFDGDGDGTPEVYVGTINNALCHQLRPDLGGSPPPEKWQCPNELWAPETSVAYFEAATGPAYVYQGRIDARTGAWDWRRVWEPDFDTEVFAFRGARVFNDALYMLSNHETGPTVWRTTDGIHYERASPPGMGAFGGTVIPPGFRGAQVFDGRLCIASDAQGAIYCSTEPSTDPASWEQVNSTGFITSGGQVHELVYDLGTVSTAGESTLTDDEQNWFPGYHAGRLVLITQGTGDGQSALILSNDDRTLTIEGTWETVPDSTSRYKIHNPAEPDSGRIWQMAPFNGHLYAIAFNLGGEGPMLWKSADPAPGNWTLVIEGGYGNPGTGFTTLRPFRNHLYLGTGNYFGTFFLGGGFKGCEILRVDASDNVELVVGEVRPAGVLGPDPVEPISGLEDGFGHLLGLYIWYMGEHRGWFYVGTGDASGLAWDKLDASLPEGFPPAWQEAYDDMFGPPGFDMWRTRDGVEWFEVSDNGLGFHDNSGVRNFMSTRWGLLFGATNAVDGFQLWLGSKD